MELHENDVKFLINCKKLIENYDSYKGLGTIYYPLKTNSNKILLETLNNKIKETEGGFLISNINHFNLLTSLNVLPSQMCLINVLSGDNTIKYLYENGVRFFVFDNLNSLNEFISYANLEECKIAIRINTMEVFNDTLMHLGTSTNECKDMLNKLKGKCKDIGISFYLQTFIKNEINALERMLNYIEKNFNNYDLNFISIAGVKKHSEIDKYSLNKIKLSLNLNEIILEPGKYLVGDTIDMITKVIRLKKVKDKLILIIKNGIYSGFLDVLLYDEKFKLYFKTKNNNYVEFCHKKDSTHNYEVYICGGSSDSGDIIGTMYINEDYKDEIEIGTDIIVKEVGAYFEEFFMPYGGDINKVYVEVDNNEI